MRIKIIIIYKAYINLIKEWFDLLNPQKRKLFKVRYEICKKCKYKSETFDICGICHCPLKPKTRGDYEIDREGKSILGCPEKYW